MNKILLFILLVFISFKNLIRRVEDWNFEAFHSEIVARHNELRKKHAASSLTILKDLSTLCQKAVDHCKQIGDLEHVFVQLDNGTYVGQNLYLSSGPQPVLKLLMLGIPKLKIMIMIMENLNLIK